MDLELRAAGEGDIPFLWQMLAFAASMEGGAADAERARVDPDLKPYVEGFGRGEYDERGDLGVVALVDRMEVGAAWVRLAPPGPVSPTKVWSAEVPELAIATVPEMRGRGVGKRLLERLIEVARGRHPSIALSVREGSDAVRLYERLGFSTLRRVVNRVGTTSLVMTRAF